MTRRKQYPLRIDPEIWAAVERWAEDDMRSANAQVEWVLRDALRREEKLQDRDGAGERGGAGDKSNDGAGERCGAGERG